MKNNNRKKKKIFTRDKTCGFITFKCAHLENMAANKVCTIVFRNNSNFRLFCFFVLFCFCRIQVLHDIACTGCSGSHIKHMQNKQVDFRNEIIVVEAQKTAFYTIHRHMTTIVYLPCQLQI